MFELLKDLIKKSTHEDENENYYNNCFYFEEGKKIGFIGAGNMATAIVKGLLKVEEICYVLMGALSKSVMSVRMPFPDQIKGAVHNNATRSFIEDISSRRSLRMITYGSFPLYLALFAPVTQARSIFLEEIEAFTVLIDDFRERIFETVLMGTAVLGMDIVCE